MSQVLNEIRLPSFAEVKMRHIINVFDELMEDLKGNPAHMVEAFSQIRSHFQNSSVLFSSPGLVDTMTNHKPVDCIMEGKECLKNGFALETQFLGAKPQVVSSMDYPSECRQELRRGSGECHPPFVHENKQDKCPSIVPFVNPLSIGKKSETPSGLEKIERVQFSSSFPFQTSETYAELHSSCSAGVHTKDSNMNFAIGEQNTMSSSFSAIQKHPEPKIKKKGENSRFLDDGRCEKRVSTPQAHHLVDIQRERDNEKEEGFLTSPQMKTPHAAANLVYSPPIACYVPAFGVADIVRDDATQSARIHKRSSLTVRGIHRYEGFWIVIWPCFGTVTSLLKMGRRVFVRPRYRFIVDITDEVAKDLDCQPPPTVLFEPTGKEVKNIQDIQPDRHYLLFPSGGFYRRGAVPEALLRTLLLSAKKAIPALTCSSSSSTGSGKNGF